MLFGFVVEKNTDLPVGDQRRKFKGRVVFQGSNKSQNWGMRSLRTLEVLRLHGGGKVGGRVRAPPELRDPAVRRSARVSASRSDLGVIASGSVASIMG